MDLKKQSVNQEELISNVQSVRHFEAPGVDLVADLWKNIEAPEQLLVLLNGFQRPRSDFRSFRKKFHGKFPKIATLAIDLRGSGDSKPTLHAPWPLPSRGINTLAQDVLVAVKKMCEELKLSTFSILGISMGGMVAQEVAYLCPNAKSVILVSTLPKGSSASEALSYAQRMRDSNCKMDTKDLYGYFGTKIIREQPIFVEAFISYIYADSTRETKAAKWQRNSVESFDSTRWLEHLQNSVLIIHGKDDKVALLTEAMEHFSKIKNFKAIFYEEVGHLILVEEIDRFVDDVGHFIVIAS